MSRYLFVLAFWPGLVRGLLRPLLPCRGRATQLRGASSKGGDAFESQQRKNDDDPYAFLADADLAASYSEKDSWAEGAATLLVGRRS